MRKTLLSTVFIAALLPTLAQAQATRTWVSGVGDDANPGSRTAPCKTFAGAISKTAANGAVNVLDPGGFGGVTITKSITIEGNGTEGSILVSGTHGIIINAGPNDIVILRNLTLEGVGNGLSGIRVLAAGSVHIENCRINGFANSGIDWACSVTNAQLYVKGLTVHNCGVAGINLESTAPTSVLVENANVTDSVNGLLASTNTDAVLTDCTFSGNVNIGIDVTSEAEVVIKHATLVGNAIGLQSAGKVTLSGSVIRGNTTAGLKAAKPAVILTDGSNLNQDVTEATLKRARLF
jgi:hypothetical protein